MEKVRWLFWCAGLELAHITSKQILLGSSLGHPHDHMRKPGLDYIGWWNNTCTGQQRKHESGNSKYQQPDKWIRSPWITWSQLNLQIITATSLTLGGIISIFSCAFWPSICLLWRNVYLDLLLIFWLIWLAFFFFPLNWAAWDVCIFWRLIP